LEDFILREKITHFDHERIPERIVHARGSAAHGFFECYKPLTAITRASLFAEAGKVTPETRQLIDEAKKLVAEARAHHESAKIKRDHGDAVRKARTAVAFAEEAIILQSP